MAMEVEISSGLLAFLEHTEPGTAALLEFLTKCDQHPDCLVGAVRSGPSGGSWGDKFAVAFGAAPQQRKVELWKLLACVSGAVPLPPQRQGFYAQFQHNGLLDVIVGDIVSWPDEDVGTAVDLRLCVRNLARFPPLRARLGDLVPTLVANLGGGRAVTQASAAALCNVTCDVTAKSKAVEHGAVTKLLAALEKASRLTEPTDEYEEDLVACCGVLTGGHPPGIAQLFSADRGDGSAFAPIVRCLRPGSPRLAAVSIDVITGVAAASPQFREWLSHGEESVTRTRLPLLLQSSSPAVREISLQLCGLLVATKGFSRAFQSVGGVQVLQTIVEETSEDAPDSDAMTRRGAPTHGELARKVLNQLLFL